MAKNNEKKEEVVPDVSQDVSQETPAVDNSEPTTMEVPVDKMQAIVDRLDSLEKSNAALREIASETRLKEAEESQGQDMRPRVHFKVLDGKVVVGWPETIGEEKKSEIIFNPSTNMPVGEILKSVYYFSDGSKTDLIDQIRFTRATDLAFARVVEDLGDFGLVEFEDKSISQEPLKIHKKYWNA